MSEPLLLVEAVALAAVLASIVQLLAWWILGAVSVAVLPKCRKLEQTRFRGLDHTRIAVGGALGVGIGFVSGAWMLGQRPHWPPTEDRDRFLTVLLPTAILVECLAALPRVRLWLAWCMRLVVSAVSAPVLLYATTYLSELAGPGSREWKNWEMAAWLMGMASAVTVVWMVTVRLLRTNSGRFLPFALSITVGGAGVTIMLSGYLTGGELALPLAGAVGGAALAVLSLRMLKCNVGAIGVGVVGLFGVLVVGQFFGELTTVHAGILLAAPLLVGVPELLPRKGSYAWLRGALAVFVVLMPIVFVVMQASERFVHAFGARSNPEETAVDDYMEYK